MQIIKIFRIMERVGRVVPVVIPIIITIPFLTIFCHLQQLVYSRRQNNELQIQISLIGNWDNNNYSMGNCNKRDQEVAVTNFDQDKWSAISSTIHPQCYILKNHYHPNVKLFKWLCSENRENKITKWRLQKKAEYLVNVYESGNTKPLNNQIKDTYGSHDYQNKISYIVTEELIRLKDLTLTEQEAVIIAYKSLLAYQQIMQELGGFIARQSMIYINRQGIVKVWVHQNLACNQFEFPHPAISESEFIESLLHQIFTRSFAGQIQPNSIYYNIKLGFINFNEVITKLSYYMRQNGLSNTISIQKHKFDNTIGSYQHKNIELKSKDKSTKSKNKSKTQQKQQQQQSNINRLKFIVAGDQSQNSIKYVKDYSQKNNPETSYQPARTQSNERLKQMRAYPSPYQQQYQYQYREPAEMVNQSPRPYTILVNQSYVI